MHLRRALFSCTIVVALLASLAPRSLRSQDTTRVVPINMHGYVLVYYRTGDPLTKDGFRLRKADLKFSGEISPRLRWRLSFDAAKMLTLTKTQTEIDDSTALADAAVDQRTRMLQDAALTYTINKALGFDIGQQIVPMGLEGTYPTAQVETIERTLFVFERSRAVGLGDVRDIGVSANGRVAGTLEYHLGVFNETGEGAGTIDVNDQKSVIGRVAIRPPMLPKFQFGGSGGFEGGPRDQRRERTAGEAQYRDAKLTLRAEAMSARDGLLRRFGWYGLGAMRPTERLQFVGRYDNWDRDRGAEQTLANAFERQIVVGVSYLLDGGAARVAVNVVRQTFPNVSTVPDGTFLLAGFHGVW